MPILTSNLVLAGTLLVSVQNPALVREPAPDIWISNPKLVDAAAAPGRVVLRARDGVTGPLHVVGLSKRESAAQRVLVVSEATYAAARRCPSAALDWMSAPPRPRVSDETSLRSLLKCGFDTLSLPETPSSEFRARLDDAEIALRRAGIRRLGAPVDREQRALTLACAERSCPARARAALGEMAPFYELKFKEGARPGRTIVFEVSLLEFSRARAAALGIRWPRSIALRDLESGGLRLAGSGGERLELGADFGEALGVGRVLARPQIRTKPGEKATFQSGGELPIRSTSAYSSSTVWKNYGLMLELEPSGDLETGAGEISVSFKLELSEPDPSTALDGVPGMKTRRLESKFDLRADETTVLTTLIQTRTGMVHEGIRGLKNLPFLEALFGHKESLAQDAELWFAVRPAWEEISYP